MVQQVDGVGVVIRPFSDYPNITSNNDHIGCQTAFIQWTDDRFSETN